MAAHKAPVDIGPLPEGCAETSAARSPGVAETARGPCEADGAAQGPGDIVALGGQMVRAELGSALADRVGSSVGGLAADTLSNFEDTHFLRMRLKARM